jgi:hypothetical protein
MMFKRAEQMEVAWSKVGAIRSMLEDFPLLLLHCCTVTTRVPILPTRQMRRCEISNDDPNVLEYWTDTHSQGRNTGLINIVKHAALSAWSVYWFVPAY